MDPGIHVDGSRNTSDGSRTLADIADIDNTIITSILMSISQVMS